MTTNLLHISDLHCKPASQNGFGFTWNKKIVEEYARNLRRTFAKNDVPRDGAADVIVATGDFVHQCSPVFDVAEEFLRTIASVFSHAGECPHVVMCPGNHDYNREREEQGEDLAARSAYAAMQDKFHGTLLSEPHRLDIHQALKQKLESQFPGFFGAEIYVLGGAKKGLSFLTIDSTWMKLGSAEKAKELKRKIHSPKAWTHDEEARKLMFLHISNELKSVESDYPIVVLSHYPVVLSDEIKRIRTLHEKFKDDEHVEGRFLELIESIERETGNPVLIFSGDVHEQDRSPLTNRNGRIYGMQFVTGRSYLPFRDNPPVPWTASSRMVVLKKRKNGWNQLKNTLHTVVLRYDGQTGFDPTKDAWSVISGNDPIPKNWKNLAKVNNSFSSGKLQDVEREQVEDQENAVEDYLRKEKLVELVRIAKSGSSHERLLQIKVGPVLNDRACREFTIEKMCAWLNSQSIAPNSALIVGLDCWGHSLASSIGYETGVPSIGISVRGLGEVEFEIETKRSGLDEFLHNPQLKVVYYVTDVIATGETLARVMNVVAAKNHTVRHSFLALIRSRFSHSAQMIQQIQGLSVLDKFPLPVLSSDELPMTDILPSQFFGLH